jgi:hypothetical protein
VIKIGSRFVSAARWVEDPALIAMCMHSVHNSCLPMEACQLNIVVS